MYLHYSDDSDQLAGRGHMKNGLEHGMYEFFWENENIMFRGSMFEGKRIGLEEEFYDNGNLERVGSFDNNSQKLGLWKYFNEDGTLEKKECWEKDKAVDMSFCKGQE